MPTQQDKNDSQAIKAEKIGILYFLNPPRSSIDIKCVQKVKKAIENATAKKLYLVVESSGGDPYSAVKIIRILRNKFETIMGIVPHKAMSAATLMLLGTNEIYMSEESQLGPLDLPMEHPTDGSIISALDVVNTLNQLGASAISMAVDMFQEIRNDDKHEIIGKNKAMELAFSKAIELVKPIASQIDPYQRQKAVRKLKIGQLYAIDLLTTGMLKKYPSLAKQTAMCFVHLYPDHTYAIFKEEAIETLSLEIKDSSKLNKWNDICSETDIKIKSTTGSVIEYIEK